MKRVVISALLSCFAFGYAFADDDTPPRVQNDKKGKESSGEKLAVRLAVTPNTMTYEGGQVSVLATVHDGVPVKAVTAVQIKPDGRQSGVALSLESGTPLDGNWRIAWIMPQNNTSNPLVYGVKVRAADSNNASVESNTIDITVEGRPQSDVMRPKASPGKR